METICGTGIRVSELRYFTVAAIRRGEISVRMKGKTREILIPGNLKEKLLTYYRREGITDGPVFRNRKGEP